MPTLQDSHILRASGISTLENFTFSVHFFGVNKNRTFPTDFLRSERWWLFRFQMINHRVRKTPRSVNFWNTQVTSSFVFLNFSSWTSYYRFLLGENAKQHLFFKGWFRIFFIFHPYLGKVPILTNILEHGLKPSTSFWWHKSRWSLVQWDFQGPPIMGPFMVSFPYYSHTTPIRIPKYIGIGMVNLPFSGVPCTWGSLKIPLTCCWFASVQLSAFLPFRRQAGANYVDCLRRWAPSLRRWRDFCLVPKTLFGLVI